MATLKNTVINNTLTVGTGSSSTPSIRSVDSSNTGLYFPQGNRVAFTINGVTRAEITSEGYLLRPYTPAFSVRNDETGTKIDSDTDVDSWDPFNYNEGNHFNRSNGRFTAPVDGLYYFAWWAQEETYYGNWGTHSSRFMVNGSTRLLFGRDGRLSDDANQAWFVQSGLIELQENDYVTIRFRTTDTSTASFESSAGAFFGYLIA